MYTVYILFSELLDKYYIGHTGEPVEERLRKHLTDHSEFTATAKDWRLVYKELLQRKAIVKAGDFRRTSMYFFQYCESVGLCQLYQYIQYHCNASRN